VNRGEIWLAAAGGKSRPVLVVTRTSAIDVRLLLTVAEVTTSIRGLTTEVALNHIDAGLDRPSVVNCDGIHTIDKTLMRRCLGQLDDTKMQEVCRALTYALGC